MPTPKTTDPILTSKDLRITLEFVCPHCKTTNVVNNANAGDFDVSTSPCELCGDHGTVEYCTRCNKCNKYLIFVLRTW